MTGSVEIRAVTSGGERRRFIDYMYERNAGDPHWVAPLRLSESERLNPRKNPFFAHADVELLLAWRGGRVVGRIAAIDDRLHHETHGDNAAMFGFFEADGRRRRRGAARRRSRRGRRRAAARAVRGPISPSLNEMCGLLVDGFDSDPMLLMPHNPPEYARADRSGRLREGQGSVRVAARPAAAAAAGLRARRAPAA